MTAKLSGLGKLDHFTRGNFTVYANHTEFVLSCFAGPRTPIKGRVSVTDQQKASFHAGMLQIREIGSIHANPEFNLYWNQPQVLILQ
jgi:hypothetical protein